MSKIVIALSIAFISQLSWANSLTCEIEGTAANGVNYSERVDVSGNLDFYVLPDGQVSLNPEFSVAKYIEDHGERGKLYDTSDEGNLNFLELMHGTIRHTVFMDPSTGLIQIAIYEFNRELTFYDGPLIIGISQGQIEDKEINTAGTMFGSDLQKSMNCHSVEAI